MDSDSKNIYDLDLKREEKILNFDDFQKQDLKFDINKLQKARFLALISLTSRTFAFYEVLDLEIFLLSCLIFIL